MAPKKKPEPSSDVDAKHRVSFYLPVDVMERARDAAYWSRMSLAEIVAEALERETKRMAKRDGHKTGEYPARKSELRPGRPIR